MIPVLSVEQMRAFDAHASERCSVPSILLMENAGRGAADAVWELLEDTRRRVVVVCGPGNNGGDGYVVARRLRTRGASVSVFSTIEVARLRGDAAVNCKAWQGLGGEVGELTGENDLTELELALADADGVVDAIFGTGLTRDVEGRYAAIIRLINAADALRVALDIPSGFHGDTGALLGCAVRARATITFAHPKLGLVTSTGAEHAGAVRVADIGVPPDLEGEVGRSAELLESADVAALLPERPVSLHKGSAGRVAAVAGAPGTSGAGLLVARGALRAGAGLVYVCARPDAVHDLEPRVLEAMTRTIDPERPEASLDEHLASVDAVAIGPGAGTDDAARRLIEHVVLGWAGTKVVDADAITAFAGRPEALRDAAGEIVLTPHPGELGRLLGSDAREVERDRFGAVAHAVERTGSVVLLKGPRTIIGAPGSLPVVNASGSPVLATGGSGDVLAGVLAALACSSDLRAAAIVAVHLHGVAGELAAERSGAGFGVLASEVADCVPAAASRVRTG